MKALLAGLVALSCSLPAFPQHRVSMQRTYERVLCVVPMVGAGTKADPKRPLYAPLPAGRAAAPLRSGIFAYNAQVSDDGQFAIVELVAKDQASLKPVLADPRVQAFQVGQATWTAIESTFRKYKANFNLDQFGVSVP